MSIPGTIDAEAILSNLKKKDKEHLARDQIAALLLLHQEFLKAQLSKDDYATSKIQIRSLDKLLTAFCNEIPKLKAKAKANKRSKAEDKLQAKVETLTTVNEEKEFELQSAKAMIKDYAKYLERDLEADKEQKQKDRDEIDRLRDENNALVREIEQIRIEGMESLNAVTLMMNEREDYEERIAEANDTIEQLERQIQDAHDMARETGEQSQMSSHLLEAQHKAELAEAQAKIDELMAQLDLKDRCQSPRSVTRMLPLSHLFGRARTDSLEGTSHSRSSPDETDLVNMHSTNLHAANLETIAQLTQYIEKLEKERLVEP